MAHSPLPEPTPVDLSRRVALKHHHGGVSVADLEASVQWYCSVLGFEVECRFEIPPVPAQVAQLKRGELRMELFQVPGAKPLPEDRRYTDRDLHTCGNKHIAFAVQSVKDTVAELQARGADIALVHASAFGSSAFIRDNTGNLIEFVQAPEMWTA
jgi:methylmalonyl-CoA/ethylmalonyl-CoA epimerase